MKIVDYHYADALHSVEVTDESQVPGAPTR